MLTLFIESIKIKNPCQIKPQNLYDKDYQRFIKELGWTKRRDNNAELGSALRMWSIAGAGRLLGSYLLTDVKDAIHYRVLSL